MADRFHILIVEDDPLVAETLSAMLELDYRVSSATTIGEALAFLQTSHVDVVLTDHGRGTEVARLARDVGAAVIEMSGYPQDMEDMERADRLHLFKPFRMQLLISTIGTAISQHQQCRHGNNVETRGYDPVSESGGRVMSAAFATRYVARGIQYGAPRWLIAG